MFCTNCGETIAEGKKFCPTCGVRVEDAAQAAEEQKPVQAAAPQPEQSASAEKPQPAVTAPPAAVMQQAPPPQPVQAPQYAPAAPAPVLNRPVEAPPPKGSKYAPISVIGYIGWMILLCLPVIGLIVTILVGFGKGPVNRRNFALAMFVFYVLSIIAAAGIFLTLLIVIKDPITITWTLGG